MASWRGSETFPNYIPMLPATSSTHTLNPRSLIYMAGEEEARDAFACIESHLAFALTPVLIYMASYDVAIKSMHARPWNPVVGVIDYIRQYTWDKQLETYVKSSGVLGRDLLSCAILPCPLNFSTFEGDLQSWQFLLNFSMSSGHFGRGVTDKSAQADNK